MGGAAWEAGEEAACLEQSAEFRLAGALGNEQRVVVIKFVRSTWTAEHEAFALNS